MASLRFPFLFSQPAKAKPPNASSPSFSAIFTVVAAAATAGAAALVSQNPKHAFIHNALDCLFASNHSSPLWGSLSLADNSAAVVETRSGFSFPSVVNDSQLLGVGLRKKSVLGLKNINVYAFGVYADGDGVQKLLREKYGNMPASELKGNKDFSDDLMEADIRMTVRLQIVYGKLSIRSVRSAFEESVGNRLQKFGESDNKELLQRFTSQFKDEYKIPRGSVIDLSREQGHVLRTTIDGKEVGRIQSKLLCRSILDLYMGEDPFDRQAKEDVEVNAASLFQK